MTPSVASAHTLLLGTGTIGPDKEVSQGWRA
jgi:hypothetical protein